MYIVWSQMTGRTAPFTRTEAVKCRAFFPDMNKLFSAEWKAERLIQQLQAALSIDHLSDLWHRVTGTAVWKAYRGSERPLMELRPGDLASDTRSGRMVSTATSSSAASAPPTHRPVVPRTPARWRSEMTGVERVFGATLIVLVIHVLVATGVVHGAVGAVVAAVLGVIIALALFLVFVQAGTPVRALIGAVIGLGALCVGLGVSVTHLILAGPGASDYTGVLVALVGIVLLILASRIALQGRRRWVRTAVTIPACFVVLQWVIVPVSGAGIATNVPRPAIASAQSLHLVGARDVTFPARDGTQLAGWYVAGRNGSGVILLHGSHGSRVDTIRHLRMLVAAGYAVLAFDARGHGRSEGQTNALGWRGDDDLTGALAFMRRQSGIDPRRIAALGLSMGGEEALRAAAAGLPLRAVISDGAGASTLGDKRLIVGGITAPIVLSVDWLTMRLTEILAGEKEPAALRGIVGRIRVPVLLIASNKEGERAIDQAFRDRIGQRASLWYVSDAGHTEALSRHPDAYAARVQAFLNATLKGR